MTPLVVVAILALCSSTLAAAAATQEMQFGCVIDAGSTGSRVYVYQWPKRTTSSFTYESPLSLPYTQAAWSLKVKPGLSSLSSPNQVDAYLAPLLQFVRINVTQIVGGSSVLVPASTPIFLGATAGMRNKKPSSLRESIMASVRTSFAASGFLFADRNARILSGEEEGVFGWIAANYLAGNLNEAGVFNASSSIGALDLGGASTQITFAPPVGADILSDLFVWSGPQHVGSVRLYTHSYLQFGSTQIVSRQNAQLIANSGGSSIVSNPCYNTGYVFNFTSGNSQVQMLGTSDPVACAASVRLLLNLQNECFYPDNCAVAGEYQPVVPQSYIFYAFSAFPAITGDVGLTGTFSLDDVKTQRDVLCAMNYTTAMTKYPESEYISTACVSLSYVYSLLVDGYHLSSASSNVQFITDVNNVEVSWALGGMLYEINNMGWDLIETGNSAWKDNNVRAVVAAFAISLLIFLLALVYLLACRKNASRSESYLQL